MMRPASPLVLNATLDYPRQPTAEARLTWIAAWSDTFMLALDRRPQKSVYQNYQELTWLRRVVLGYADFSLIDKKTARGLATLRTLALRIRGLLDKTSQ